MRGTAEPATFVGFSAGSAEVLISASLWSSCFALNVKVLLGSAVSFHAASSAAHRLGSTLIA